MKRSKKEELELLTSGLLKQQKSILEQWEKILTKNDKKSTELASMSRREFLDNIPTFLERFYDSLKGKETVISEIGKLHGSQRWEYGLNLQQTIKEWGLLHKLLIKEINSLHSKHGLSSETLKEVHETLTDHIQEGMLYSIRIFDKLKNSQTMAQLRDLEEALGEPRDIANHNLRDTSHDLKGMVKNLQMGFFLLEDEELGSKARELIDQMSIAADSLEQLLNDLLDLFRLEANREEIVISEFDVAKVVSELCESMQLMAETEKLDLICRGAESLIVKSDQKKLQRIVRNLVLNALKYTAEGYIKVRWEKKSGEQWLLEISDTGPGLSATHASTLTTSAESPGAAPPVRKELSDVEEVKSHGEGIGLMIVRHLCKLLDAIIEVESLPGEGTSFFIRFPIDLSAGSTGN